MRWRWLTEHNWHAVIDLYEYACCRKLARVQERRGVDHSAPAGCRANPRVHGGVLLVEPGIVRREESEDNVAPDIAIVLPDRLHLATGRALSGMPNIVIEIVSEGSVEIDYVKKRALYARTAAQAYWIIDWLRESIEVWTFIEPAAQVVTHATGQTITTPLLPDVSICVDDLLR